MNDLELKSLLQTADEAVPVALQAGLAARVQRRFHRRQMIRRRIILPTVIGAVVIGVALALRSQRPNPVVRSTPDSQTTLAQLEEQAQAQTSLIDRLEQIEAASFHSRRLNELNAFTKLKLDTHCAVGVLLARADELHEDPQTRGSAETSYRQIAALFPDMPEAQLARQRIASP